MADSDKPMESRSPIPHGGRSCPHCGHSYDIEDVKPPDDVLRAQGIGEGFGRQWNSFSDSGVCPNCGETLPSTADIWGEAAPPLHFWTWEGGIKPALGCLAILAIGSVVGGMILALVESCTTLKFR